MCLFYFLFCLLTFLVCLFLWQAQYVAGNSLWNAGRPQIQDPPSSAPSITRARITRARITRASISRASITRAQHYTWIILSLDTACG